MIFEGVHVKVSDELDVLLERAYPYIDRGAEYAKMDAWCEANPQKRPRRNWKRFINGWLNRTAQGETRHYQERRSEANIGKAPTVTGGIKFTSEQVMKHTERERLEQESWQRQWNKA